MKIETIRKVNKSKVIIGGLIGLGVVGAVTILPSFAKYRTTQSFNLVNGKITYKTSDFNLVAMYVVDGNTETPIDTIPGIGYELDTKSICTVNNQDIGAKIEYNGVKLLFDNITQKGTKCNVYFNLIEDKQIPQINSVTKTSKEKTSITISVDASDNVGVTEYWYSINTVNSGEYVKGNGPTYTFNGLIENTEYTIKVKVKDVAGNEKEWSGTFKTEASGVPADEFFSSVKAGAKSKAGSFTGAASASNTGIFSVDDGEGTSYYYRGKVTNNYVSWAGKCWRIVRFNGDGSIRIIYDGTTCHANGANSNSIAVTSTAYNKSSNDNAYVGYMYGSTGQSSYAVTHANTNGSNIKNELDSWYDSNLAGFASDIDPNAGFCNDRKLKSGNGYGTKTTTYGSWGRVLTGSAGSASWATTQTPILSCAQSDDLFTPSGSNKGNGKLSRPIGLITADEVIFAGAFGGTDSTYYWLYNNQNYWTMSPYYFYGVDSASASASVFRVNSSGALSVSEVDNYNHGVRPVVNLKSSTLFEPDTDGTRTNPYKVIG